MAATKFHVLPADFDYLTIRVKGSCMEPVFSDRDTLIVESRTIYFPGDLVAFRNGLGELVCHRFLGYILTTRGWLAMLRANNAKDPDGLVRPGSLLAKVVSVNGNQFEATLADRVESVTALFRLAGVKAKSKLMHYFPN